MIIEVVKGVETVNEVADREVVEVGEAIRRVVGLRHVRQRVPEHEQRWHNRRQYCHDYHHHHRQHMKIEEGPPHGGRSPY